MDHAAKLRSYIPNGDGYNSEFAHDLAAAADELDRLTARLPATKHSASECSAAFEWLRCEATREGAPPEAGVALDEWHALAATLTSNAKITGC